MLNDFLIPVALVVCLTGCGTFATETWINQPPAPMVVRPPDQIEVYASRPPSRPHVDVALIQVEQTQSLNEQGTDLMIRTLRQKAGAIGCDAVFISGVSEHAGADVGSTFNLIDPAATNLHAVCMVYTSAEPVRPFRGPAAQPPLSDSRPRPPAFRQHVDGEDPE